MLIVRARIGNENFTIPFIHIIGDLNLLFINIVGIAKVTLFVFLLVDREVNFVSEFGF